MLSASTKWDSNSGLFLPAANSCISFKSPINSRKVFGLSWIPSDISALHRKNTFKGLKMYSGFALHSFRLIQGVLHGEMVGTLIFCPFRQVSALFRFRFAQVLLYALHERNYTLNNKIVTSCTVTCYKSRATSFNVRTCVTVFSIRCESTLINEIIQERSDKIIAST